MIRMDVLSYTPHDVNLTDSFVCGYWIDTFAAKQTIDDINNWYDTLDPSKLSNGQLADGGTNKDWKDSVDAALKDLNPKLYSQYAEHVLQPCLELYKQKYNWSNMVDAYTIVEGVNVQEYKPNSNGYAAWHSERGGKATSQRHLVWITYLNDVNVNGETAFLHQNIKIKPQKGLTIIFPVDWTHVHKGYPSPEVKRIATGWWSFI
jgi:hypothetical protein